MLRSLSARLLVLTIAFVMLAEVLIYAPSVARFRRDYLQERIAAAHLASLAVVAAPDRMPAPELERELLEHVGAHAVVLRLPDATLLALSGPMPPRADATVDLRRTSFFGWVGDAFVTLTQTRNRVLRVMGASSRDPAVEVEVVMDEWPMRTAMIAYSWRILALSIVISLITAGLVFAALQMFLVRPMRRMTASMIRFRENPEDASAPPPPTARRDEVGTAQRELAAMQGDLRAALIQKTRLAALGAAVAKINHDLRGILSTAVLVSDRLAASDDPEVRRVVPRLVRTIDRAIALCGQTLAFAREGAPRLMVEDIPLRDIVCEAVENVSPSVAQHATAGHDGPGTDDHPRWRIDVSPAMTIQADRDALSRILENLTRNAVEAGAGRLEIAARRTDGRIEIEVADDGPGLPPTARNHLFEPFAGSARAGGTGLGLAIARDLARAHGGDLVLIDTGSGGTRFRLDLPVRE